MAFLGKNLKQEFRKKPSLSHEKIVLLPNLSLPPTSQYGEPRWRGEYYRLKALTNEVKTAEALCHKLHPKNLSPKPVRGQVNTKRQVKSLQSNNICEHFPKNKSVLDEIYRVAFRKKVYGSLEELKNDLDLWSTEYDERLVHTAFMRTIRLTKEKILGGTLQTAE